MISFVPGGYPRRSARVCAEIVIGEKDRKEPTINNTSVNLSYFSGRLRYDIRHYSTPGFEGFPELQEAARDEYKRRSHAVAAGHVEDVSESPLFTLGKSDLPNVPLATDLADTENGRRAIEFFAADSVLAWPLVAPPDIPAERFQAEAGTSRPASSHVTLVSRCGGDRGMRPRRSRPCLRSRDDRSSTSP